MSETIKEIIGNLTGIWWIAYLVVGALAIVGLANVTESLRKIYRFFRDMVAGLKGQRLSDAELKKKAEGTGRSLIEMTQERQRGEPEIDFDRFHESASETMRYTQETQNIYARDYAGIVSRLRDEFHKRNIQDEELDKFYMHPTNYIGLRMVGVRLRALSEKL